jgi:hypothetical protein
MFGFPGETVLNYTSGISFITITEEILSANSYVYYTSREMNKRTILICYSYNCPAKVKTKKDVIDLRIL